MMQREDDGASRTPSSMPSATTVDAARNKLLKLLSDGDVKDGRRSRAKAAELLPAVKTDAGLPVEPNPLLDGDLTTFVVEVVLGAAWYTRALWDAKRKMWAYVGLNSALVVLLPVGLSLLGTTARFGAIVPQISGVLTGVLALQKTLSAWFVQQQRYAAWYKAGSDLKSIYYGFVDACAASHDPSDASIAALLRDRTGKARGIIEAEKTDFYRRLALPSFDLLDMLTSNKSAVTTLVSSFAKAPGDNRLVAVGTKVVAMPTDPDGASPDQSDVADANVEMLAGDPEDELTPLAVAADDSLNFSPVALSLVSDALVDSKTVFLKALEVAGAEADDHVSRTNNQARVTEYLALVGYPYADKNNVPTRFCAAGVTWAATKAYCEVAGVEFDVASELQVFQRALPEIRRRFFRPSAGCKVIRDDARKRGTWISRTIEPAPGWLVLYHWNVRKNVDPSTLDPEHIGYVVRKDGDTLHTIEFNTTFEDQNGSQGNGGSVSRKNQRHIGNVVGYVQTYSLPAYEDV